MAENIVANGADIFGNNVTAAFDESECAGRQCQVDGGAGRRTETDHFFHPFQAELVGETGGEHDIDNVAFYFFVDIYIADYFPGIHNFFGGNYRFIDGYGFENILTDNSFFFLLGGITDNHFQHKTVNLSFGQRIGSFLLDGVLRGHHQKRSRQFVRFLANGYLTFLHGFEQRALNLGRCTVYLVGQHEVGKNGAVFHQKFFASRAIDHGSDNVGRQQVGRELHTVVFCIDQLSQRLYRQRFCQSRHTFQQDMPVGQQSDQQRFHQMFLAYDHFIHSGEKGLRESALLLNSLV